MKYGNKKMVIDGIKFASQREGTRYCELKLLLKQGLIQNLEMQKKFLLIPTQKSLGKTLSLAAYYADFVYTENGQQVIEDAKGMRTTEYILKKKMMKFILGLDIKEV